MRPGKALLLLALLAPSPLGQEPAPDPNAPVLARASEAARAAWLRLQQAGAEAGEPVSAFHLRAEVRNRDGVRANDLMVEYRFLNPHFIRFALPGEKGTAMREIGRGPGAGQKAYWLMDPKDGVVVLQGREYTEDRRVVDEMLVVSRNFLALSDLSRLSLTDLAISVPPQRELMPKSWALSPWWRRLTWLRLESPDFALLHPDRRTDTTSKRPYVVELGLDAGDGLPRVAIVREKRDAASQTPPARPMLFRVELYELRDGFLVPNRIHVHPLVLENDTTRFRDKPTQEIDLLQASLRPGFTPESFRPQQ